MFPNPRVAAFARRTMFPTLLHEYTRTSKLATYTEDAYGKRAYDDDYVKTARCLYVEREEIVNANEGRESVNVPTLVIDRDDPLDVGDTVSAVVDRLGNVLAAGPLRVDDVKILAAMGGLWRKQAVLKSAEPVR